MKKSCLFPYLKNVPRVGQNCFLADGAKIIGDVEIHDNVNVWFNTVIRGDVHKIVIKENTNVQDLSMIHVTEDYDVNIGKNVSIGHNVIIHGANVKDHALIGMGAILLDNVVVGENSLVAAGSVLPPNKVYPDHVLIMGNPARVIKTLDVEKANEIKNHYKSYLILKNDYRNTPQN